MGSRPSAPLVSIITVGEMLAFARRNGWGARKLDALQHLAGNLVVVDIGREPILRAYADLDTHLKKSGSSAGVEVPLYSFQAFGAMMGFDWVAEFDRRYRDGGAK